MKNLLLPLFLLFSLPLLAQTGIVRGKITDEIGLGLPGANIFLKDLTVATATDVNGNFTLLNVPAGEQEVQISFIGYEPVAQKVMVSAGQTVMLNLSLEPGVTIGTEVLILGDRLKGQAKALNQQKNNINITNIVAADQIGRFPDANMGDAMKRIPGITMQGDQGEARNIIVRGFAPQLNAVRINGERIPSAEGDNRNVQLDLIPSDMIQTVEVNKALTPDMEADALGGAVNLVTRSASSGLRISGTAASGYNLLSQQPIWTGGLIISNRFANDRIGLLINGSINDHVFGSDNVEPVWANEVESPVSGEDIEIDPFIEELDIREYQVRRLRRSLAASLDFKLNDNHTLYLQGMYNWRDDWENRYRLTYRSIEPIFEDGTENIIGWQGETRHQSKGGLNSDRIKNARLEDQRTQNYSLRGDHLFGKIRLDWQGSFASASETRPNERYLRYEIGDAFGLNMDLNDPMFPLVTPVKTGDIDPANFQFDELTEENGYTYETDLNFRADLSIPTNLSGNAGFIKLGGRIKAKDKERDNDFFEYSPLGAELETMNLTGNEDYSNPDFLAGSQYQAGIFPSAEYLGSLDLTDAAKFEGESVPGEFLPINYTANETVTAGYAMWSQNLSSKLTALAGLRVENTSISYTGNQVLDEEELLQEVTAEKTYTNILPGLHLKFNPSDNFVLRAAWTNSLARPNYFDLVPFQNIIAEDEEIAAGNADLDPTRSMNLDLMAENYFKSIGLLSGGVFYKRVNDFIYTFVDDSYVSDITGGDEWTFFQPLNGGSANVYGFEFALQRQLDFLPGALKGLGVYLNYTYTGSTAEGIRNADGEEREGLSLPGAAPHLINASLSFETKRLVLRASLNYAHEYIDEVGGGDFTDRYYDRQLFVDANGSFAITPSLRIFAEANNLTNQPLRYFQGIRERTQQVEYYNARFNVGLKFDLFKK
jgi:TonB-dependent receptor